MAAKVKEELRAADAELTAQFGGHGEETATEVWLRSFNDHKQSKLLVAAASAACNAPEASTDPTFHARTVFFTACVLREAVVPEDVWRMVGRLVMLSGVSVDFALAVAVAARTTEATTCYDRLVTSIRSAGASGKPVGPVLEFVEHLKTVPSLPVEAWPIPGVDPAFEANWKTQPSVYEYTAQLTQIKSMVTEFHDWALACSTVLLNALWCSFYVTGEHKYIRRIMDVALPWSKYTDTLGMEYIGDQRRALPDDIAKKYDAEAVRCQASRLAVWQLLVHSRVHPEVMVAVANECVRLADYVVAPSVRPVRDAAVEADARDRIRLFPSLVHLIGRTSLDSLDPRGTSTTRS